MINVFVCILSFVCGNFVWEYMKDVQDYAHAIYVSGTQAVAVLGYYFLWSDDRIIK